MSKRRRTQPSRWRQWIETACGAVLGRVQHVGRAICGWFQPIPIEVLLANQTRRRSLEHDLRRGIRQLRRALGTHFPPDCAVVVQQIIQTDRQLAGCYQVSHGPEGRRFALVRLALTVDGHSLDVDEVLAALAEQCIGLAIQTGGPSVLVPIDFSPSVSVGRQSIPTHRADPLAPRLNGTASVGSVGPRDTSNP